MTIRDFFCWAFIIGLCAASFVFCLWILSAKAQERGSGAVSSNWETEVVRYIFVEVPMPCGFDMRALPSTEYRGDI